MSSSFTDILTERDAEIIQQFIDKLMAAEQCYYMDRSLEIQPIIISRCKIYADIGYRPFGVISFQRVDKDTCRTPSFGTVERRVRVNSRQILYSLKGSAEYALVLAKMTGELPSVRNSI